jgi:Fe-S cluster assembly protein SufD
LAAHSQTSIIEDVQTHSKLHALVNSVTSFHLDQHAKVSFTSLQRNLTTVTQINSVYVWQAQDSLFSSFNLSLGHCINRQDITCYLKGPGAKCEMNGAYFLVNTEHADNHLEASHQSSYTESIQNYRGIFDHQSHGVFNGKVVVNPGLKQVSAQQTNHNLLLSNSAEIDTKPELEIYSDEVKCSHGATVGQLNEEALFYLMSRGIKYQQARAILLQAFIEEQLAQLSPPFKDYALSLFEEKLAHYEGGNDV